MIPLHDGAIEGADDLNAFVRVCVVTHNVAETNVVRNAMRFSIGQNGLKRL
jgi:hypothetical protein